MINIRKRGKVYQYSFEIAKVDGKRWQITKSEAQKAGVIAYNEYMNNGKIFNSSNMSYADYLEYWISTYANLNLKYSTIVTYYNIIKIHLKPRIGHYMLSQIDLRLLQQTINKIYALGNHIRTRLNKDKIYYCGDLGERMNDKFNQIKQAPKIAFEELLEFYSQFDSIKESPDDEFGNYILSKRKVLEWAL